MTRWQLLGLVGFVCVGLAGGLLLFGEKGLQDSAAARFAGAPPTDEDGANPTGYAAASGDLGSASFDDRPLPLADWFERLDEALDGADQNRRLALRTGLRQRLRAEPEARIAAVFQDLSSERSRAEAVTLWIDTHGLEERGWWMERLAAQPVPLRSRVYLRLARLGSAGRTLLQSLLAAEDEEAVGAEAIAWLFQTGAQDAIATALNDAPSIEARVRRAVLAAMIDPAALGTRQALRDLLRGAMPYRYREAVADALAASYPEGLRNEPTSQGDLMSRGRDTDPVTRSLALRKAGDFVQKWKAGDHNPEDLLAVRDLVREAAVGDPDPMARRAAVLSRVGLRPGVRDLATQCRLLLEHCGNDPDAGVRAAVLKRVHRGCAHSQPPFAPTYLRPYIEGDPDPDVRVQAIRTLPRYGPVEGWRDEARSLLLWSLQQDPDPGVRLEAAARLTELGFAEARPHLLDAALKDPDQEFRDLLFEEARRQLSERDPEFVKELARLKGLGDIELEAPEEASAGPIVFSFARTIGPLQVAAPEDLVERARARREEREQASDSAADPTWHRTSWTLLAADGTQLEAAWDHQPAEARPLVIVLPPDPLMGGVPWAVHPGSLLRLLRAEGYCSLWLSWRGRGRSEGHQSEVTESALDLGALRAAVEERMAADNPGWKVESPPQVLAMGPTGKLAARAFPASWRVLPIAEQPIEASSPRMAAQRGLQVRPVPHLLKAIREWLER